MSFMGREHYVIRIGLEYLQDLLVSLAKVLFDHKALLKIDLLIEVLHKPADLLRFRSQRQPFQW